MADGKLLEIRNLRLELMTAQGLVHGVRGVDLSLEKGEIHGIIGESGCGKTLTAKSILGLHDRKKTLLTGQILYTGEDGRQADLLELGEKELRRIRGKEIAMVFQDPLSTLNPLMTVGEQIAETMRAHLDIGKKEARQRAAALLEKVGIFPGDRRCSQYPFEFSGGMLQRVCIAMAICCSPRLLIADEPTTALDVTTQAQILEMLGELQRETGMAVLIITHNFGVVAELCRRVSVMYAGQVVESGPVEAIFHRPAHPYTADLMGSVPSLTGEKGRLKAIPGAPPDLREEIPGCPYAPRCGRAGERCRFPLPETGRQDEGHWCACSEKEGGEGQ